MYRKKWVSIPSNSQALYSNTEGSDVQKERHDTYTSKQGNISLSRHIYIQRQGSVDTCAYTKLIHISKNMTNTTLSNQTTHLCLSSSRSRKDLRTGVGSIRSSWTVMCFVCSKVLPFDLHINTPTSRFNVSYFSQPPPIPPPPPPPPSHTPFFSHTINLNHDQTLILDIIGRRKRGKKRHSNAHKAQNYATLALWLILLPNWHFSTSWSCNFLWVCVDQFYFWYLDTETQLNLPDCQLPVFKCCNPTQFARLSSFGI